MEHKVVSLIASNAESFWAEMTIDTTSKEVYIERPGPAYHLEKDTPFDVKITTGAVQNMKVINNHIRIYPDENTVISDSFFEKAKERIAHREYNKIRKIIENNFKLKGTSMKNHDDFADVLYYYVRHENCQKNSRGTPFAVVAVRENDDGTVNRGVSMCSPLDVFKKITGRGIAMKRLIKAETDCKCSGKFESYAGDESHRNIFADRFFSTYAYKSGFHEKITDREYRMFHKPEQ